MQREQNEIADEQEVIATFLTRKNENDSDWNFRLHRIAIVIIFSRAFVPKDLGDSPEINHGNHIALLVEKTQQWDM